jgi:hypothetical protein
MVPADAASTHLAVASISSSTYRPSLSEQSTCTADLAREVILGAPIVLEHDEFLRTLVHFMDQRHQGMKAGESVPAAAGRARTVEQSVEEVRRCREPRACLPGLAFPVAIAQE